MKNTTKFFALTLAMLTLTISSFAQVSATATTSANIITPIAITKTVDMNFGNIAVSPTVAGTVVLVPAGTRTATGGVTLPAVAGTVTAASFAVTGLGTSTYAITLPGTITLNGTPSGTMTLGNFASTPSGTGVLSAGAQTILVGGTLNVGAGQTAGVYTNSTNMTVTVNYN
ncbi:MAG: DUF4402 domain-containing protein [Candidatus Staskawiczbacteria bacterium]|nr:DUF4402 domain-containing protein [Candidatus Staskawiczbacteria bacterium]